jgi:tetratricopeptide (TPR) repeat protein
MGEMERRSREAFLTVAMASLRVSICGLILLLLAGTGEVRAAEDITLLRAREGAAALLRGQYDKAIASYNEALQTPEIADFIKASIYSDRGVAKWRQKQLKDAIEDFNLSIKLSPENATVYNNRGNVLMDLGHPEEAVKDFDRAIALSSNYGAAYNNRGNAHAALAQYEPAFQDFRKAVELMPTSAVPFNGRGKAHSELKRYHAALRDFTKALSLNSKYSAAYQNRGEANLALQKYKEAADDLTQALQIEPDQPELLLLRGRAYAGDKKFNAALEDFNKSIELKPELIDPYIERGILYTQVRRFDDAITDLSHVIEIDAKNVKAYAMRASARLQAQANDEALSDVNQALTLAPDDPLALRIRGGIYEALNRQGDAISDYGHALAQDPFQTESREALQRLAQEVPPEQGEPLGPPVSDWVIKEPAPGRYIASNPKYPSLRADLEMFGSGKPKILEWSLLKNALAGVGLLRYYAGDLGEGQDMSLEYVAIVDTYSNKVISIEPYSWGPTAAEWTWAEVSVVVKDPEGNANEIKLRKPKLRPVARDEWGFDSSARGGRGGGGGGGGGLFDWLFKH